MLEKLIEIFRQFDNMRLSEYNLVAAAYAAGWGHDFAENAIRAEIMQCIKENPHEFDCAKTTKNNKPCYYWNGVIPPRPWDKDLFQKTMADSNRKPQLVSASGPEFLVLLETLTSDSFHISEALIKLYAAGYYLPEQYPLAAVVRMIGFSARREMEYCPFEYLNPGKSDGMIVKRKTKNSSIAEVKQAIPDQKTEAQFSKPCMGDYEWVYIFMNPAMPGWYKIGRTNNPERRLDELSRETSAPENFQFCYLRPARDAVKTEREIHSLLKEYRPNKKKEWFRIDPMEAVEKIEKRLQVH